MLQISKYIVFLLSFCAFSAYSQIVSDDFSDGDFTNNPVWTGDTDEFIINGSNQLQSNGPAATETLHLVTANTSFQNVSWSIWVNLDFSPSSSNYSRIYLMSDQENLEGDLNGYYIELGESGSNDAVELYRQEGDVRTEIFSLDDGAIASAFTLRLLVTRSNDGLWTISVDYTGGSSYTELGSVTDNTITATSYFGVLAQHSSTRNDLFYFDDLVIDNLPDTEPPVISSITVLDANNIEVFFDEDVEQTTAETVANYSVNNGIGQSTSATRDATDLSKVTLNFSIAFTDALENTIEIINVKDLEDNAIPSGTPATKNFTYFAPDVTPPVLTDISILALNQIVVEFDEPVDLITSQTVSNYSVNGGIGQPNTAVIDENDQSKVVLTFDNEFTIGNEYEVAVQNIQDTDGNQIVETSTINFTFSDIFPPKITKLEVVASNAVDVYFNEAVEEASAQVLSNYSKDDGDAQPVTAIRDINNNSIVHLFFSDNFSENTDIDLTISNVADLEGNVMAEPQTASFHYDTRNPTVCSTCVTAVSANELDIEFSEKVDQTTSQILNHYEVTSNVEGVADIGFPISATRDASDSTIKLVFASDFAQENEYNVRITKVRDLVGNEMVTRNRSFEYDTTPPSLFKLTILSNDTLQLTFSEEVDTTSAQNKTNYIVNNSIENPDTAIVFPGDQSVVKLYFSGGLGNTEGLNLTIENIADQLGNTMTEPINEDFSTLAPSIAKVTVITNKQLEVLFSEDVTTASAQLISNYVVNKDIGIPIAATQDGSNSAKVVLDFDTIFETDTTYTISIANITDLTDNVAAIITENLIYDTRVMSVRAVSNNLVEVLLTSTPVEYEAEDVSRFTVNNEIGNPLSATSIVTIESNDDTTRMVQLAFAHLEDDTDYQLTLGTIALENGKTIPVSTHDFKIDKTPPSIAKAEIIDEHTLHIYFSEDVDEDIAEGINHYSVNNGIGNPEEVVLNSSNDSLAVLTFTASFAFETSYELTVTNIQDLNGLELVSETINIQRSTPPGFGDIVITEIFADPEPSVGLPEREYIELYNNTDEAINLVGLEFSDPTTTTIFPSYELAAGAYLIIVANGSGSLFEIFGSVLEISNFPSLNSDDEHLTLRAADGSLVFDISYDQDWYQNETKEDGGYSLEIVNPSLFNCHSESNWIASASELGGTPGQVNSVNGIFHDQQAAEITDISITGVSELQLSFNEDIDSLTLIEITNYSIDHNVGIQSITYISNRMLALGLDVELDSNIYYQLSVQHVSDCAGNQTNETYGFGIGFTPEKNELVISEILADETPSVGLPLVEYIELYNRSTRLLNLRDLIFSDAADETTLSERLLLPDSFIVITKTSAVDSFPDVEVMGISSFPSLNSSSDILSIKTQVGDLVNSVNYDISWYKDEEKENGGYSLEIIDPDNVCNGIENWTASNNSLGGTPGLINSVDADNPDVTTPNITEILIKNTSEIEIIYSEKMDTSAIFTDLDNYQINQGIIVNQVDKINDHQVSISLSNELDDSFLYELSISNITDCAGNPLNPTIYKFGIGAAPQVNEIVISEILADETPSVGLPQVEYIELYNRSTRLLNLKDLIFSDATDETTLTEKLLLPDSFIVLTRISAIDSFPNVNVLGVSGFPSLNNSGELLSLKKSDGTIINSVDYESSWYGSDEKDDGGYALEIIDPDNLCNAKENWTASTNTLGGTPGLINSVNAENPDLIAPTINAINILSNEEIEILFSEKMDTASSFTDPVNYNIDNGVIVTEVTKISNNKVVLKLENPISETVFYQLTIQNIHDCAGNAVEPEQYNFGIGSAPLANEIIITEIFADETPPVGLPQVEYIELYNRSSKLINVNGLILKDATDQTALNNALMLPGTYLLLTRTSAIQNFTGISVLGVSGFPSLNNSGELLSLENDQGLVVNAVDYSDDWYKDAEKDDGGYSLEIIDTDNVCNGFENWTASIAEAGGTPGLINSVDGDNPDITQPRISSITIISATEIEVQFSEKMDVSAVLSNPTNYSINNGLSVSSVVIIDETNVKVEFTPELTVGTSYTLTIMNVTDCAGNTLEEATHDFEESTQPRVIEINIISSSKIEVIFSEPMSLNAELANVDNYALSEEIEIVAVQVINETSIELTFGNAIGTGVPIELTITNIKDKAGSPLASSPIAFGIGMEPEFNDIVISEIHAFPSSENELPEIEFIELFNRTNQLLSLEGLIIQDEKNQWILPGQTDDLPMTNLLPGEYLILTSVASSYTQFGKVIEISDWSGNQFSDAGEQLILTNNGELVFEIAYDNDWYQSLEAKEDGGTTLEMIDTNNPCGESNNWRASEDIIGGTPGKINSVSGSIQDGNPPKLIKAEASDANTLRLTFNEKLKGSTASLAVYELDNNITASFKESIVPNTNQVYLDLNPELEAGITYTVTVSGLQDCLSNTMSENSYQFKLPEEAEETDILINEILFNPESNGSDYVELYNHSDKYINLQGWQIANASDREVISQDVLVMAPREYLVLTEDIEAIKNTFPNGADSTYYKVGLPAYGNDDGAVLLYDNSSISRLMQKIEYDDAMHFPLIDDVNGVSLERINLNDEVNNHFNWRSASSLSGFGTPGYLNSQNINRPIENFEDCFGLSTEVLVPDHPTLDGTLIIKYGCNNIGTTANITIYDMKGKVVKQLVQNATLDASGSLPPWNGLNDEGNLVRVGYYIIFIETFDLSGNVNKIKKTIAVGNRF